jgi:hypothetical protein
MLSIETTFLFRQSTFFSNLSDFRFGINLARVQVRQVGVPFDHKWANLSKNKEGYFNIAIFPRC